MASHLLLAFVVAWLVSGTLRAASAIVLNAHLANGMPNLAVREISRGFLAPDFLAYAVGAALVGWAAAFAVARLRRVAAPHRFDSWSAGAGLGLFFAIVGAHEVVTTTAMRDTMSGRLILSPVHVAVLALALVGTLLCVLAFRASLAVGTRRSSIWAAAIASLAVVTATAARTADGHSLATGANVRNVVLISIDTLRADHLSCYGYGRLTSPNIDKLAADGVLYEHAFSQAPNTHPSMASMVTSELPSRLGDRYFKYIPYDIPTMAEAFENAGYHTGAVVSNVWLKSGLGFDQGFDDYDQTSAMSEFYRDSARVGWRNAADVSTAALGWLDKNESEPFFLWLHYLDPHHPYDAPAPYNAYYGQDLPEEAAFLSELRAMQTADQTRRLTDMGTGTVKSTPAQLDAIVAAYDAEIAFTDAQVGRVVDSLRERGLLDDTVIVVTADHGEEFRDHNGWGHAHTLYNELLHVPLVIRYPDGAHGVREQTLAGVFDIAPTMLGAAGIPIPKTMRGADLRKVDASRSIASVLTRKELYALQNTEWKVITGKQAGTELFHVADDAHERKNLSEAEPKRAGEMVASLQTVIDSAAASETEHGAARTLDARAQEQLRALGYLE